MGNRVLRAYRMLFERVDTTQSVDAVADLGLRSKLGGEPDWQQWAEWPNCRHCRKEMTFVGQLDSLEHDSESNPHRIDCLSDDQEYMFGDVGLIYIFFCFECTEAHTIVQF
jgi:hypothetical protein